MGNKKNGSIKAMELPVGVLQTVKVDDLILNLDDNRTSGMEESSIQELANDIKKHGLLQNIIVRKVQKSGEDFLEVMGGNRRTLALRKAGIKEVSALVYETLTEDQAFLVRALENEKRVDPSFIDRAKAMKKALDMGWTQKKIAEVWGVYGADVSKTLSLLKLPEDIQRQIHDGYFTFKAALSMTGAKPEVMDLVNKATAHVVENLASSMTKTDIKNITTDIVSTVANTQPDSGVKDPKAKPTPKVPPINLNGAAEPPVSETKPRNTANVNDNTPPVPTPAGGKGQKPETVPPIPATVPPRDKGLSREGILAMLTKLLDGVDGSPIADFIEDLLGAFEQTAKCAQLGELIEVAKSFKI